MLIDAAPAPRSMPAHAAHSDHTAYGACVARGTHAAHGAHAAYCVDPASTMLRAAVEHAFVEARALVARDGGFAPLCVTCSDQGLEVTEHRAATAREAYASLEALLAQAQPVGYAFIYDGSVDTPVGLQNALICEAASQGDARAAVVVRPYEARRTGYCFGKVAVYAGGAPARMPRAAGNMMAIRARCAR